MGFTIQFNGPTLLPLAEEVKKVSALFKSPEPLLRRWAPVVIKTIHENFRSGGHPHWVPLKPWTLASRDRAKEGRKRGGGNKPLHDTGDMERGWNRNNVNVSRTQLIVYNPDPKQVFHEFGTNGPYPIVPKSGKTLALPFGNMGPPTGGKAKGRMDSISKLAELNFAHTGQRTFRGLSRSPRLLGYDKNTRLYRPEKGARGHGREPAHLKGRAGKRVVAYEQFLFVPKVMHPGIPARPVLPIPEQISPRLKVAADIFFLRTAFDRVTKVQHSLPPIR